MAKNKIAPEVKVEVVPADNKMPALDLVPYFDDEGELQFRGNYADTEAYLKNRLAEIKKTKLKASDMDTVKKYKAEARGYRTGLEAVIDEGKRKYFNAPKAVYEGKGASLFQIIAEMEAHADKILEKEEADRIERLNAAFDAYKEEFQETYALSVDGLARIEYKKPYYNKGAVELDTRNDIEAQFKSIKAAEDARKSSEAIIKKQCVKDARLNEAHFIERLDQGVDLALILDEIDAEKERLAGLTARAPQSSEPTATVIAPTEGGAVSIGVSGAFQEKLKTDFPGRNKTILVKITYPCDLADELSDLFALLAEKGIESEVVTAEEMKF